MREHRLGDVIDDHCIKCRRITNHSIVSILNSDPAKVRCRTCYNDHDFRHEIAPPSKKDLKKAELFNTVLASVDPAVALDAVEEPEPEPEPEPAPAPKAAPKPKGRAKKS